MPPGCAASPSYPSSARAATLRWNARIADSFSESSSGPNGSDRAICVGKTDAGEQGDRFWG